MSTATGNGSTSTSTFTWIDTPKNYPAYETAFYLLTRAHLRPTVLYPPGVVVKESGEPENGKRPIGKGWGLEITEKVITSRFDRFPRAGCGVCLGPGCGPDGQWLVDIEGDGPQGTESRLKLLGGEVVETIGWGSARGGHQLFTIDPERIQPILARLKGCEGKGQEAGVYHLPELPDLELRIGGWKDDGQTLKQLQSACPPTIGTDGKPREWDAGRTLAALPEAAYAFLERIAAEREQEQGKTRRSATHKGDGRAEKAWWMRVEGSGPYRWFRKKLDGLADNVAKEPQDGHNRHNALRDHARTLGGYLANNEIAGPGYLIESEVIAALRDAGRACGLPDAEIEETIRDGIAYGRDSALPWPKDLKRPTIRADGRHRPGMNGEANGAHAETRREGGQSEGGPEPAPEEEWEFANFHDEFIKSNQPDNPGKYIKTPLRVGEIAEALALITPGWPKCVGADDTLFLGSADYQPIFLDSATRLFAWIDTKARVNWTQGGRFIPQERFYEHLRMTAEHFDAIETLPHWPEIPRIYYMHRPVPEGGNGYLGKFLDFFCPATAPDRELIKALILTLFWGGEPGSRPAFLVTGPDGDPQRGRGIGKSKVIHKVGELVGEAIDVSPTDPIAEVKTRLLSDTARQTRFAKLDNVKTLKFSWADLEGLITTPTISGRMLYRGEGRRPNTLVWGITLNGASLSTDMAQRVIPIQIRRHQRSATWETDVSVFIEEHRWEIMAEIRDILQRPCSPIEAKLRWSTWEAAVLARCEDPAGCQAVILERQESIDDDEEEKAVMWEFIRDRLESRQLKPDTCCVFIRNRTAAAWVNEATTQKLATNRATTYLDGLGIAELRRGANSKGQRGFCWRGEKASANATMRAMDDGESAATEDDPAEKFIADALGRQNDRIGNELCAEWEATGGKKNAFWEAVRRMEAGGRLATDGGKGTGKQTVLHLIINRPDPAPGADTPY